MKEGKTSCTGQRIRMDRLDGLVLERLASKLFEPDRFEQLLHRFIDSQESNTAARKERLRQARDARGATQAAIARLLTLVETGAMEPDDPELKERLGQLKLRRNDLDRDIAAPCKRAFSPPPPPLPRNVFTRWPGRCARGSGRDPPIFARVT